MKLNEYPYFNCLLQSAAITIDKEPSQEKQTPSDRIAEHTRISSRTKCNSKTSVGNVRLSQIQHEDCRYERQITFLSERFRLLFLAFC